MSIPSTFAPVKTQDFTLRAVDVHKSYSFSSSYFDTTSSGYFLHEGFYRRDPTPIGAPQALNDPTNSSDGTYKHVIWKSVDQRYYRFPYDVYATLEHANRSVTDKLLFQTASFLSIPYFDYGLYVKSNSTTITNTTYNIGCIDDGYGNLRATGISTSSFLDRSSLVGYWGFNQEFRRFKYDTGVIESAEYFYESWNHSVDQQSIIRNVTINTGVPIAGTGSGLCVTFNSDGYILASDRNEFNFVESTDFTIATWVNLPTSQSVLTSTVNDIISKNGVLFKTVYGYEDSPLLEGSTVNVKQYSSSHWDQDTDCFPYSLQVYNQSSANSGKLLFKASNGIKSVSLTSTTVINDATFHHAAVTKSGSLYTLYVDGVAESSSSINLEYCSNEYSLMFGAKNRVGTQGLSGSLDEIRFYEYAAPSTQIATLSDKLTGKLYQTNVVGNVFNRRGVVTISTLLPLYQNMMKGGWSIDFRGTHTIYQYECLCRIRKGDFNLSMNPTGRVHPKSDKLIDDFTGSLLKPYATTVGLYNDFHELVAVAKLAQPLKMRDDVDINILVSWDV